VVAVTAAGPIDGLVLFLTVVESSVPPSRVPELLAQVQVHLGPRVDDYRRNFECVHETADRAVFLVSSDHWETVGSDLGFDSRELDAVRRAHNEQLLRIGSDTDRREEFESALEIRDATVLGLDGGESDAERSERGDVDDADAGGSAAGDGDVDDADAGTTDGGDGSVGEV
jgi:hypothetical protein